MNRRDSAGWLLAGVVRLLPAGRSEWGVAMRADLAGIDGRGARRQFAVGCARVVLTRPAVLRRIGYPLLMSAMLAVTLWWTARIGYAPLHWGAVTAVTVLLGLAWLGRHRGPFGPVADDWTARGVRAGGYLLLTGWTAALVAAAADKTSVEERARFGVPIFTVLLTVYLAGFLTLTARRSTPPAGVLVTGLAAGGGAAAVFTAGVLLVPPIPAHVGPAVTLIVVGMAVAAALAGRRGSGATQLLAMLLAGTVACTLILTLVIYLSAFGAPGLIPDLAPPALPPADALVESRIELPDPYLRILLLGGIFAAVQSAAALLGRRRPAPTARA